MASGGRDVRSHILLVVADNKEICFRINIYHDRLDAMLRCLFANAKMKSEEASVDMRAEYLSHFQGTSLHPQLSPTYRV
ncbi:hypothetical protein AKJ16_DCAP19254 [Drosera capensis]